MSDTSDVDGDVVGNPVNTDVAEDTDTAENTNNVGSDGEIDDNGGGGAAAAIEAGSDAGSEAGNSAAGGNEWSLEYNATFRCALCRFPFEKGDAFHVESGGHKIVGPFKYSHLHSVHIRRKPNVRICMVRDMDEKTNIRGKSDTDAYHGICLEAWGHFTGETGAALPPRKYFPAFGYWLTPTWSQDMRRKDRIRRILAEQLPSLLLGLQVHRLPAEIVQLILDDEMVQWLTVHAVHETVENHNSCSAQLGLTKGIWARYMFIDGVRYVEQLTRAPPDEKDSQGVSSLYWCKLLDGPAASRKTQLFTLVDHLGVRQICFGESGDTYEDYAYHLPYSTAPDAWWRTMILRPHDNILAYSDRIKIRSVHALAVGDATTRHKGWDYAFRTPMPPPGPLMFDCYTRRWNMGGGLWRSGTFYMDSVILNAPGTTAYSAFWGKGRLLALRAHRGDEKQEDLSFYRDYDRQCPTGNWIHFPMGPGERFTDIYRQTHTMHTTDDFLLRTNHGRNMILAHTAIWLSIEGDPKMAQGRYKTYHHFCSFSVDEPTRLSYNASPYGVKRLAVHHVGVHGGLQCRGDMGPITVRFYERDPKTMHHEHAFQLTSAVDLNGVASVTPSYKRHRLTGLTMLCGMLFHYKEELNKAPHVLGEYRLNRLGETIDLTSAERIYFGWARVRRQDLAREQGIVYDDVEDDDISDTEQEEIIGPVYLADVFSVEQVNTSRIRWFPISLDCIVQLWFIGCRSHVYYPC